MPWCMCEGQKTTSGVVLSFHNVRSRAWTLVFRLISKHLYPVSHFGSPNYSLTGYTYHSTENIRIPTWSSKTSVNLQVHKANYKDNPKETTTYDNSTHASQFIQSIHSHVNQVHIKCPVSCTLSRQSSVLIKNTTELKSWLNQYILIFKGKRYKGKRAICSSWKRLCSLLHKTKSLY